MTFSNTFKAEIACRLKTAMQGECFWMPKDTELAADFGSVERNITEEGRVKPSAPRSSSGHGDRFWAASLAVHAAVTHKPFRLVMAA